MVLPNRFVRDYVKKSWCRQPAVFRGSGGATFASPDEIFSGLVELAERLGRGERNTPLRLYSDGRLAPEPRAFVARREDQSFCGYLDRLERELGSEVGLMVNQFQVVQPRLFVRCANLLDQLYESIGMPAGGASLELFAGNYTTGPFGVHKDEQEVITFVIEGRKRFLLWPFEDLQPLIGSSPFHRDSAYSPLERFDYRPHRSRAVVLEGGPGDILCWPREWWHVAESDGGRVTTIALGLFRTGDPLKHLARSSHELWRTGVGLKRSVPRGNGRIGDSRIKSQFSGAESLFKSDRFQQLLISKLLSFQTAAGFHEVPDIFPASDEPPGDGLFLRASHPSSLAWNCSRGMMQIAARGSILNCPAHPRLMKLLQRFVRGELLPVSEILRRHSGRSETKDTVFLMEPEELRGILGELMARAALVSVTNPDK